MKILLVAATPQEISPLMHWMQASASHVIDDTFFWGATLQLKVLLTGVGSTATAWHLGVSLTKERPDWVINAGIAGALDLNLALGAVVQVVSEHFADLGAEDADGSMLSLVELGLLPPNEFPYTDGVLRLPEQSVVPFLPVVEGITVNRVHGCSSSIEQVKARFPTAAVESMEGAAVYYGCLHAQVPFVQIRAISNYVAPRDRSTWQIGLAVQQLNNVLIDILATLLSDLAASNGTIG
jgi:futalosine hydrolase